MVPWIAKNNAEECFDAMEKTDALYCFGHFEIAGFELHKGQIAESGLDKKTFLKFHKVLSGHFHTRSQNGNIIYVGSPFEMTWNDYNDPRGFHIFDTDTGELEFIKHNESMFFKVEYKDNDHFWQPYKPESIAGKFVKVLVLEKNSYYEFDSWIKKLQEYNPNELQIYESTIDVNGVEIEFSEANKALSNIEIIQNKINALPEDDKLNTKTKSFIANYMTKLYNESNVLI
jgi:DNA repair exonuclease SbcCD nuclease subunit